MRIIVKNYYKKRKPEKMITWWWREARQVTDRQPNAAPSEENSDETGVSMPTRLPANSRMTKSKKAFSRTRFANLIRRNSIQLRTKGKVQRIFVLKVHHFHRNHFLNIYRDC